MESHPFWGGAPLKTTPWFAVSAQNHAGRGRTLLPIYLQGLAMGLGALWCGFSHAEAQRTKPMIH